MTDTPTPADVAEAADKLQSWLDGDQTGIDEDAVQVAVNVMRSAPPAPGNGAAEMREAAADICDQHASIEGIAQKCAAAIRALPAPEVPEAVRKWCERWDGPGVAGSTSIDFSLRDHYRKEYNL